MNGKILSKKSGFSMVEAVVASLIFSVAMVGVFASLGSVQKPVAQSDKSLQATYCGQQVLETFKARVDIRDWDTGSLSLGDHTIDNSNGLLSYSACVGYSSVDYTVSSNGANGSRKVVTTVTWQ